MGGDHPRGARARRDVHVTVRNVKATGARILAKTTKARGIKPAGSVIRSDINNIFGQFYNFYCFFFRNKFDNFDHSTCRPKAFVDLALG